METATKNNFLGTEKEGKLLLKFVIPCVLSLIIQSLYNLVDQIFIGHTPALGAIGNAATGIVYPLTVIALGIGLWLGDGTAACLSLNQGRNNNKSSAKSVGTALTVATIFSIILIAICFPLKNQILSTIGASGEVLTKASEYSNFIFGGFFFFVLATVINPVIRADGNPKYAMIAMVSGALINIVLDPIFLYVANLGMTGAALATFIGQGVTFLMSAAYLVKSKTFSLNVKDLAPDFKLLKMIFKFGISSLLTQLAIVIISIVVNILLGAYSFASGYDVEITQGVLTLAFKVFGIIISIVVGIAAGGQPILGYNYGAKNHARVLRTLKLILISTAIVGVIATILFEACPDLFLLIFGDGGENVDHIAYRQFTEMTFRIYLGFIFFTCIIKMSTIFFQAIGQPVKATLISVCRDVIILVPVTIIFCVCGGINLMLWSAAIADVLGFIIAAVCLIHFVINYKKSAKLMSGETEIENKSAYADSDNSSVKSESGNLIITIAREHGSGGRKIGELLAQKLSIPFYDKNISAAAAEESGMSESYFEQFEKYGLKFNDALTGFDTTVLAVNAQKEALNRIAERGSAVIVGRAADVILKDKNPFRVFIQASQDTKIERVMRNYGDSRAEAINRIKFSTKRRMEYYYLISDGKRWTDVGNYDLCINSDVGIEKCVEIICDSLKKIRAI